jgi:hypothetical protein
VDPVFPKDSLSKKLYAIVDKNENVFLAYLNKRWQQEYTKDVVERQKDFFIP